MTYLCDHHDDKAAFVDLVVSDCLCIIVHHFSVGYELLSCSILPMCRLNVSFQSCNLLKIKDIQRLGIKMGVSMATTAKQRVWSDGPLNLQSCLA